MRRADAGQALGTVGSRNRINVLKQITVNQASAGLFGEVHPCRELLSQVMFELFSARIQARTDRTRGLDCKVCE